MMTETQSLEIPASTGAAAGSGLAGGSLLVATSENFSSKRQRRPSVRLGDIGGEQHFDSTPTITTTTTTTTTAAAANPRKNKHHSKDFNHRLYHHHHHLTGNYNNTSTKSIKSRPLLNSNIASATSVENIARDFNETLGLDVVGGGARNDLSLDSVAVGSWKPSNSKSKRGLSGLKRVRSNWGGVGGGSNVDEIGDDARDFDHDGSQSPLNDQFDRGDGNDRDILFHGERREFRAKDRVELSVPSGTSGDRNNGHSGQHGCFEDGVKVWLKGLGLGRYAPVFEVHEVDDEVLPMLTLEDLKDMGINAVGPRRKMFCAIQKLGQEFA